MNDLVNKMSKNNEIIPFKFSLTPRWPPLDALFFYNSPKCKKHLDYNDIKLVSVH